MDKGELHQYDYETGLPPNETKSKRIFIKMNKWENAVRRVLDFKLGDEISYDIDIRMVGEDPYINLDVLVETDRYHQVGPKFEKKYQLRLDNFEDEIISHLKILGAENNLNSITYHKVNTDWTQRFKHLLESEISNFVEQYDTDYGKLVETPKLLGFKKNPMSPYISIAIDLFGDRDGIRQNLWETLHRSLPISDMGIDYDV
jgi:hypothetical protein